MNSDLAADHIHTVIFPKIFLQYLEETVVDCQMTQQEFMHWLHVSTIDPSTAFCWLKNLGFCFDTQQKVYFNDHHKNPENIIARKEFIKRYFDYELFYAHRWVQVPIDHAKYFESETDLKGNHLMTGTWACEYQHENGTLMQEYHVDCHPEFFNKYVTSNDCKKFGGNLSICIPDGAWPKMLIGQDECIIKENSFSSKQWNGSEGQSIVCPKDDGHSWMLSCFVWHASSFNVEELLTPAKLEEINACQQQQSYISIKSALEVKKGHLKSAIKDCSSFCRFFEYSASKEGYWNYNHTTLQLEDLVDCLVVLFPDFDFFSDQSSGHGKRQKDGLSIKLMNKYHGSAGPVVHPTLILEAACLGPYPKTLVVGDTQSMIFEEGDDGPFYLSEAK